MSHLGRTLYWQTTSSGWPIYSAMSILGLRHHQLRWPVGQVRWGALRRTLFRRDLVSEPDLRTCSAVSLDVCLLASSACVRRARAARVSHRTQPHIIPWKMKKNTECTMFSAQRLRPHLRKKNRSLDRRLARHVRLPPKPTLRGPFLKGLSDAGDVRVVGTPRCW